MPGYLALVRRNRNFRLLWFAQIVSELGDWFYTVAIYSLLLEFTHKAASVGFAFLLQVLPQFFIAPVAGVVNDRLSRRRVMMFADWTRAVVVLSMVLVTGPGRIWLLYTLLFLETVLWGLFEPGRNAAIPNIVPEGEVIRANTLASITWSLNFTMGAAVGGLLAAYLGRDTVFVLNSLSFVGSALLIRRTRFAEPHAEAKTAVRARDLFALTPVMEGIRYVRGKRRLRATIFVKCGIGVLGANWVILPVLGERVFAIHAPGMDIHQAGMLGMSALMASRGAGAILGPTAATAWAGERGSRLRLTIGLGFLAAFFGYVGLGFAATLALACLALVIAHSGLSSVWVISTTMLQLQTDDAFRGRVFAAEFGFAVLTMSASSLIAGWLVDGGMPVERVAVLAGVAMLAPVALWAWAQRFWREKDRAPELQ